MRGFTTLQNTKTNIKQAILERGVPVQDSGTFASYAQKISNIRTNGSTQAEQMTVQSMLDRSIQSIETDDVALIRESAFRNCYNLVEANFPKAISIGGNAFQNCTNLTTINFPNVTSIGYEGFGYCYNLVEANFPNVTSISSAFTNCTNLSTINFPNITSIDGSAFRNCRSLTIANFPGVTSISGYYTFSECASLVTANFPNVTSMEKYTFRRCTNLTTINFPNVTNIGNSAFNTCINLTTADFPNVTSINDSAFQNCSNLTTTNFPNVTSMGNYVFQNCTNLTTINFPNVTFINKNTFQNCKSLTAVNFPSVTSIEDNVFRNCKSLKKVGLGANQVCTLNGTNVFTNTPIADTTGYIFVPPDLISTYKEAPNWTAYKDQIYVFPDPAQPVTLTINNNVPSATYTYVVNGEVSSATGNILADIPKYSMIEYRIKADGYSTVNGKLILEDSATIDITMTTPSWRSFTQPVLSANGVLGGDDFAVSGAAYSESYEAWHAFDDPSGTTYFRPAGGESYDLIFYNPNPLKVSQLVLTYSSASYSEYPTIILSVSDDNVTWTQLKSFTVSSAASQTLDVSSSAGYLYYRISFTRGVNIRLMNCAITAQEYA